MKINVAREPHDESATTADVIAAIESLSPEQFYRLKGFAIYRIRGLGRAAMGETHAALLNEAIASTLQGAEGGTKGRKWAKNRVLFIDHLFGAMRSISTHWKEAYERAGTDAEWLESELRSNKEEDGISWPSKKIVDPVADPFRRYVAKELLEILDNHFAQDDDALLVIEARKEGMTIPEIVDGLGLTKNEVNAALQRIRYFVRGLR